MSKIIFLNKMGNFFIFLSLILFCFISYKANAIYKVASLMNPILCILLIFFLFFHSFLLYIETKTKTNNFSHIDRNKFHVFKKRAQIQGILYGVLLLISNILSKNVN